MVINIESTKHLIDHLDEYISMIQSEADKTTFPIENGDALQPWANNVVIAQYAWNLSEMLKNCIPYKSQKGYNPYTDEWED